MPGPKFPHRVVISTPGAPRTDPQTRNQLPGTPTPVQAMAYLAQSPVAEVAGGSEVNDHQTTTLSRYTMLVPPGTVLTSESRVTDVDGALDAPGLRYEVVGRPAKRTSLMQRRAVFIAASLKLISDLQ
jgi:hypothetical protein